MTSEIDVVVVTYDSEAFAPRIARTLGPLADIASLCVVDNSPDEATARCLESQTWVRNRPVILRRPDNPGFGGANNHGASVGTAPYLLLLNPDVAIDAEAIHAMAEVLDSDPEVDVAGVQLARTDGTPVASARYFPTRSDVFLRRVRDVVHRNETVDVDWLCGAVMMWRRDSFERLGGFDPRYFLYYEDVDICRRLRATGGRAVILGGTVAVHDQGHGQPTSRRLMRESRRSRRLYASTWLGTRGQLGARLADLIEITKSWARAVIKGVVR